jgi:hypothetical protein
MTLSDHILTAVARGINDGQRHCQAYVLGGYLTVIKIGTPSAAMLTIVIAGDRLVMGRTYASPSTIGPGYPLTDENCVANCIQAARSFIESCIGC